MDKQSLDLIEEGQQVDQWAVKQLLSSLRSAYKERDHYKEENEYLRAALSSCAKAVGVHAHETCSAEFLADIPKEIALIVESLRAQLKAAQKSPAVAVPDDVKSQIYRLIETCEKFYGTDEARGTVAKWLEDSVQSPRITEQDAREIVEKIARNVPEDTNDNPMAFANEWALFVIEEAKELLNKLNGVSHEN